MGKVLVSGDIHGENSIRKLSSDNFNKNNELGLTKEDYLIITGDFGLIWDSTATRRERWWLDWLEKEIANKLDFHQWFFGHHHQDRELFDGKYQCMYHDIAQII